MTLPRPDARLALASGTALSLAEGAVARLQVELSLGEAHDSVLAWLWPDSKLAEAVVGDSLAVALGTGDGDPEAVLATEVTGVDVLPGGTLVTALAPTHRLGRTYVGRSWRSTTLGQVVRDLLSEGEVTPARSTPRSACQPCTWTPGPVCGRPCTTSPGAPGTRSRRRRTAPCRSPPRPQRPAADWAGSRVRPARWRALRRAPSDSAGRRCVRARTSSPPRAVPVCPVSPRGRQAPE